MLSFTIKLVAVLCLAGAVQSQTAGTTTRYWDCCKASCSWNEKAIVSAPVKSCAVDGKTGLDPDVKSGCDGGTAYMCDDQTPWAIDATLAYGYAAASIGGQTEAQWCCACYELTFTSGPVSGQRMIVQVTNTGGDLGAGHFDIALPGGGVGIFNGCTSQYGAPADGWGSRYGGVSSAAECSQLPSALQAGCNFRFDWFKNADNPNINFQLVSCPAELTARTGCVRS